MYGRRFLMLMVLSFSVLAGGCRRVYTFVPVEGAITQGGKPLVGVHVFFYANADAHTEGPRSWGTTDAAGHYRLRTDSGDDGAVVGQHRVCILELFPSEAFSARNRRRDLASAKSEEVPTSRRNSDPAAPKVPPTYGSIAKTPLRAEVRPGSTQTIDFDIP